jgi:hypothetical protein
VWAEWWCGSVLRVGGGLYHLVAVGKSPFGADCSWSYMVAAWGRRVLHQVWGGGSGGLVGSLVVMLASVSLVQIRTACTSSSS